MLYCTRKHTYFTHTLQRRSAESPSKTERTDGGGDGGGSDEHRSF